jgi:hypothetical protein
MSFMRCWNASREHPHPFEYPFHQSQPRSRASRRRRRGACLYSRARRVFLAWECLAAVAVGNSGEGDVAIAANRVQVPAECVNVLAVGATDTRGSGWAWASYSSVGSGRSPGLTKPELVAVRESTPRPFLVLSHDSAPRLEPTGAPAFPRPVASAWKPACASISATRSACFRAVLSLFTALSCRLPTMPKSAGTARLRS